MALKLKTGDTEMQYNGHELKAITEPQIFDPPKKMLVWDDGYLDCYEKEVSAITEHGTFVCLRDKDAKVYDHCAEIPDDPKPRMATNRELAKWLAQGNGEMTFKSKSESDIDNIACPSHCYEEEYADEECDKALKRAEDGLWIVVRKWDDTEWHEPTVDYMGLEE